jgi:hypothetical protein
MDIFNHLNAEYFAKHFNVLSKAKVIVVDGNISSKAFEYLARFCHIEDIPLAVKFLIYIINSFFFKQS